MSAHAELSPSGGERWMTCTASVEHNKGYPNKSSAAATEGTTAHEVVEYLLRNDGVPPIHGSGKGDQYSEEMVEHALGHYQHCMDLISQDPEAVMWIESQVKAPKLSDKVWGTADTIIWLPTLGELHVIDYKYGRGIVVEVEECRQLMIYAVLTMATHLPGKPVPKVILTIVQPRISHQDGPIRSWLMPNGRLREFAIELKGTILDINNGRTKFEPSDKACKFCPGIRNCSAVKALAERVAVGSFEPVRDAETHDDLAEMLGIVPILDAWAKSVNGFAHEVLERGDLVPGYKMVRGKSNRAWLDADEAITWLRSKNLRLMDVTTPKILGIPAIEKLVKGKRNIKPEEFKKLIVKPEGKLAVAKDSDPRPAVDTLGSLGFEDVTEEGKQ